MLGTLDTHEYAM